MISKTLMREFVGKHSTFERLVHLQWAVFMICRSQVRGEFVEVGCNEGKTSAFLALLLQAFGEEHRTLHLYDSFQGLPKPCVHDQYFSEGDLPATQDQVREHFLQYNLPAPIIHAGWLADTLPADLPQKIAFGYLDVDFYESTKHALSFLYPRLVPGGLLIVDDYADLKANPFAWNLLPGVKRACDEVMEGKPERIQALCAHAAPSANSDLALGLLRKEH